MKKLFSIGCGITYMIGKNIYKNLKNETKSIVLKNKNVHLFIIGVHYWEIDQK